MALTVSKKTRSTIRASYFIPVYGFNVCVLIGLAAVGAGIGFCVSVENTFGCDDELTISIGDWQYLIGIGGQYYVFVSSLLILLAIIAVWISVLKEILINKIIVGAMALSGAVLCLINGSVESYYSSPYFGGNGMNESWVAAAGAYFLAMIAFAVDAFMTFRNGI